MKDVRKIFNFRPVCLSLVCMVLGICCVLCFFEQKILLAVLILLAEALFVGVVFFRTSKKLLCLALVIVFALASLSCLLGELKLNNSNQSNVKMLARVCDNYGENENGTFCLLVENVKVVNVDKKMSGKAYLYSYSSECEFLCVGDEISFDGSLFALSSQDVQGKSAYRKDIRYYIYVTSSFVVTENEKLKFDEKIRKDVYKLLSDRLDDDNASLFYAMLFGDTSKIDEDVYAGYKSAGIAHILAVSGLHIGFLVLLLEFALSKICKNKKLTFVLMCAFVAFYAYVAGFSPSVLRALVMTVVCLFGKTFGLPYDNVSSLCFSACLILIFKPLYIFDLGFLLSFFSVFGILTLCPILNYYLKKVMKEKIADLLSVSLCAGLATLPICVAGFNSVSVLSLICNIALVPIASLCFMILLPVCFVGLIFPAVSVLLLVPSALIDIVNTVSFFVTNLEYSTVTLASLWPFAILFYLGMLLGGDLCLLKPTNKIKLSLLFVGLYFIALIIINC